MRRLPMALRTNLQNCQSQNENCCLPDKWKDWGTGFINTSRWLEITYNNLKK